MIFWKLKMTQLLSARMIHLMIKMSAKRKHELKMQIFLESNFGVVFIIDIEVVLFAVFTMSQFQTNYRGSLDRTDTSFFPSKFFVSKQRMADSSVDVNGEIDLNLNVTGKGGGQIAVIVIGVLVAVICILLILYFSCR